MGWLRVFGGSQGPALLQPSFSSSPSSSFSSPLSASHFCERASCLSSACSECISVVYDILVRPSLSHREAVVLYWLTPARGSIRVSYYAAWIGYAAASLFWQHGAATHTRCLMPAATSCSWFTRCRCITGATCTPAIIPGCCTPRPSTVPGVPALSALALHLV